MVLLNMASFPSNSIPRLILSQVADDRTSVSSFALEQEVLNLFDLLRGRLLRYATSFGLTMHDGEDVIQEAFMALFRHLQLGRSRENLQGWIFRVTHNLALKRRAQNQSSQKNVEAEHETGWELRDPNPGPEEQVLFSERQARLKSVLRALPETDRACLSLRAEGLRYREISKVLGISLGSVAGSLARSLARMERTERLG
jgi:RNA polymerase sigma-70 factor (ECF subfamily)